MAVKSFYANTRLIQNKFKNTLVISDFEEDFVELVRDCIVFGSQARVEPNDQAIYEP